MSIGFTLLFNTFRKRIQQKQKAIYKAEIEFQKALSYATLQAEQKERSNIAMDLHDDMGGLMTILKLNLLNAQKRIDEPENLRVLFTDSIDLVEQASSTMRQISNRISPPILSKLGLIHALKELFNAIESTEKIRIHSTFLSIDERFKPEAEINIYRIITETLNNVLKYANTESIYFNLEQDNNFVVVYIRYYGEGLNNDLVDKLLRLNKGTGLKSIQNRITNLNATIDYSHQKIGISEICAKIPYNGIKN